MQVAARQSTVAVQAKRQSAVAVSRPSRAVRVVVRAETKAAEKKAWVEPTLDSNTPSPIFGGSTGGLLRAAQTEEFYVITWEAKKEQIFEMPTGGAAIMRKGPNLLKFAKKEQCIALTGDLRSKLKLEPSVYRVFPDGKVQFMHPKDGVYPEKVNAGRTAVNFNSRRIGQNIQPPQAKFTGKGPAEF